MQSKNEEEVFDVEQTRDGKYIVMFMSFTCPPPPKGDTPEEAIEKFKEYRRIHEDRIRPALPDSEDVEGTEGT